MNLDSYPDYMKQYILELSRHGVIDMDGHVDKMFINYLYDQRFDEDYIKSLQNDRLKDI